MPKINRIEEQLKQIDTMKKRFFIALALKHDVVPEKYNPMKFWSLKEIGDYVDNCEKAPGLKLYRDFVEASIEQHKVNRPYDILASRADPYSYEDEEIIGDIVKKSPSSPDLYQTVAGFFNALAGWNALEDGPFGAAVEAEARKLAFDETVQAYKRQLDKKLEGVKPGF